MTLLFTDIERSTAHWERQPAAMSDALQRHDLLLRQVIEANGGHVFKTLGDAFYAAFSRASDAATAGVEAQRALGRENWSVTGGLAVRMALNSGATDERDGDYFGPAVNRVARLIAIGHGGQILVSGSTASLLRGELPDWADLRDLGEHRLKDLADSEHVWQLTAPGLVETFPPLRSLDSMPNNLPRQVTPLIGRADVLGELETLVEGEPLVTLVGSGGVGKTRVALQVAADLLDGSGDGVWFVDLAPLTGPSLVGNTIATVLGLREQRERPILETLVEHLATARLLLILDNCEHVIEATAQVAEAILHRCPDVRILATSREPLRLHGERVYRMPSLPVPPRGDSLTAAAAAQYGAIALFLQRAVASEATFALTDENAPSVAEICIRLDGIPLAIELAAARVKVLAPRTLAKRLDERFRILTGGVRTALPRQQTMRALIDWSYNLLSEKEQLLFARVSIFVGGWTLEAAEAVCTDDNLDELDAVDLLSSLVEKSLVAYEAGERGTRYHLLESTRAFAIEKLQERGERDALAARHAGWIAGLGDRVIEISRRWTPLETVMGEFEVELDNARAAVEWAIGEGRIELAARMLGGLCVIYQLARGDVEPRRWLDAVIPQLEATGDAAVAARLWRHLAGMMHGAESIDAATRGLEFARRSEDKGLEAAILSSLAAALLDVNRLDDAAAASESALRICREAGLTRSHRYMMALLMAADIQKQRGGFDEARELYSESLKLAQSLGEELGGTVIRFHWSDLEFAAGDVQRAVELVEGGLTIARRAKSPVHEAGALVAVATYRHALDDSAASYEAACEALSISRRSHQDPLLSATAIRLLALNSAIRGDVFRAARLSGYVAAWYARAGISLGDYIDRYLEAQLVSALSLKLSDSEIDALTAEGAQFTQDEAVGEALAPLT